MYLVLLDFSSFLPSFLPFPLPLLFLPSLLLLIGQTCTKRSGCHALGLLKGTRFGQRAVVAHVRRQRWGLEMLGQFWAVAMTECTRSQLNFLSCVGQPYAKCQWCPMEKSFREPAPRLEAGGWSPPGRLSHPAGRDCPLWASGLTFLRLSLHPSLKSTAGGRVPVWAPAVSGGLWLFNKPEHHLLLEAIPGGQSRSSWAARTPPNPSPSLRGGSDARWALGRQLAPMWSFSPPGLLAKKASHLALLGLASVSVTGRNRALGDISCFCLSLLLSLFF